MRSSFCLAGCAASAVASLLLLAAVAEATPRAAPVARCVVRAPDRRDVAVFDVKLRGSRAVRMPRGRRNHVSGGTVLGRFPVRFRAGHTRAILRVRFGKRSQRVRWRLAGHTAVASAATPSCGTSTPAGAPGLQPTLPPDAPAGPGSQPASEPSSQQASEPSAQPAGQDGLSFVSISTTPALQPAFSTAVSDYVTRCDSTDPVLVDVGASDDRPVSVDGQPARSGHFETPVPLSTGQRFDFTAGGRAYHVRCLPADFPVYQATVAGTPQAQFFFISTPEMSTEGTYAAVFDNQGVPLWWRHADLTPYDFKPLADGNFGSFGSYDGTADLRYNEFTPAGVPVRTTMTVGGLTDSHDYQELPAGHRYLATYHFHDHVDVSAYTGKSEDTDAAILEAEVQELDADGNEVWHWNANGHVSLDETGRWWPSIPPNVTGDGRNLYDVNHINSIEPNGSEVVISMRHDDAIYAIDKTTGDIDWKLGGTPTPQSLTIVGDDANAAADFGGQHDARILPDGTLTLHDNGTGRSRAPRALRFALDTTAGTATLIESVTDPHVSTSKCCGSARKLPTGDWVMSWGMNGVVTELSPSGARPFELTFESPTFSYRANPVMPGNLDPAVLRAGMDAQFPRG